MGGASSYIAMENEMYLNINRGVRSNFSLRARRSQVLGHFRLIFDSRLYKRINANILVQGIFRPTEDVINAQPFLFCCELVN